MLLSKAKIFGLKQWCVLVSTLLFFSACESPSQSDLSALTGVTPAENSGSTNTGTTLSIVGGNFQIAAPSANFTNPLVVQLLDNGTPLSGKSINFTFTSAATGSLSAASVVTNASGIAQITVTAGPTSGTVGIRASYNSMNANFTETIVEQSNTVIEVFSGNTQTAAVNTTLTNQLQVFVKDATTLLPAPNIIVTFLVTAGNGQINGTTNSLNISTDALGIASVNFKTGTLAGGNTVKALIASNVAQFVNFTSTGTTSLASFDLTQSTVTSNVSSMISNGTDISILTFTLKDSYGNILSAPTGTVVFSATNGTLLPGVTNVGNGTYTQILLTPSTGGGSVLTVSATYNAAAVTSTASINLVSGSYSVANSTVTSSSANVVSDGTSYSTITVTLKDSFGNQLTGGGQSVVISKTGGGVLLGGVTDVGNGTYIQLLKSTTATGSATVTATVNTVPIVSSASVTFIAGAANASTSALAVSPSVVAPDNSTTSTIVLTTKDIYGNVRAANSSGGSPTVTFATTLGTLIGSAVDNGNGTFQQNIKSNAAGTATITAVINGVTTTSSKLIYFNNAGSTPNLNNSLVDVIGSTTLPADGTSTSTVKVTLKDNANTQFASGGNVVVFSATGGTLIGSVSDNGNGTYTQLIQSPASSTSNVVISATVDGSSIVDTASMNFYGAISLATSTVSATSPSIEATGSSTTTIVLTAKDSNGVNIPVGGATGIALAATTGTLLGSLLDNNNGTYTQLLQSTAVGNTSVVSATKSAVPFSATTSIEFFVANNWAGLTMDCTADDAGPDFSSAATSIAKRIRLWGNNVIVDNGTLTLNTRSAAGYCPGTFSFSNFIVRNNSTVTHTAISTGTTIYNIEFSTITLTIDSTSKIDVDGKGLNSATPTTCRVPAGTTSSPSAQDTNVGWRSAGSPCVNGGGGSHGGEGGPYLATTSSGSNTYGNLFQPTDPGSSSGYTSTKSVYAGGGIVKITATGTATVDGSIRAAGANVANQYSGAGAGGSVWLNVGTLTGSGYVSVNGGNGAPAYIQGGGGGGGRMAVYYTNLAGNFSLPTNIFSSLRAYGGLNNYVTRYGAAGTIYLKGSTQTYGDLLINNNGYDSYDIANAVYPKTNIKVPSVQTPTSITGTVINKTSVFQDNYKTDFPYANWYVNPNTTQNATLTRMDDAIFKVTSGDADSLNITSGLMTSAPASATTSTNFELMLVFDHVEIRGKAHVSGPFILALNGDISSNNTHQAIIDGYNSSIRGFEYDDSSISWTASGVNTLSSPFNLDLVPLRYSTRNYSFTNGYYTYSNAITANDFSLNSANITGSTLKGTPSLSLSGSLSLTNSSNLTHTPASLTVAGAEYSLEITAAGLTVDATSAVHADGSGYLSNTSGKCRSVGNKEVNGYNGSPTHITGASHGGYGSMYSPATGVTNQPYGSITNPYTAGASCYFNSGGFGSPTRGGGIVRINLGTGTATINGRISSNGVSGGTYTEAGAGGSIMLDAGPITGTGYISANGGADVPWGGGGSGGRIAVNHTSLSGNFSYPSNIVSNIRAFGGYGGNGGSAYYGGAGTVFIKDKSQSLGDLIVNNNGNDSCNAYVANYRCGTAILSPARSAISSITANTSTYSSASIFQEESENTNAVVGFAIVPNINENGNSFLSTKTRFPISSLSGGVITTSGTGMGSVGVPTNTSAFPFVVRNLEVTNKGMIYSNENIIVTEGDISSANTTSFVLGGGLTGTGTLELADGTNVTVNSGYTSHTGFFSAATSLGSLTINTNGIAYLPTSASISGNLTMSAGTITGSSLTVGGNINLSGTSNLTLGTADYSPNLIVTGDIALTDTATISPKACTSTTPFRLYATAANITIGATAAIDGSGKGTPYYSSNSYFYVPTGANTIGLFGNIVGAGYIAAASYGGMGGDFSDYNGAGSYPMGTYGNLYLPNEPGTGSNGWNGWGGTAGGGAIRLNVSNTLTNNGSITANGTSSNSTGYTTGSGGGIIIETGTITGTGTITANGGALTSGTSNVSTGGGGRIAIKYTTASGNFTTTGVSPSVLSNVFATGGPGSLNTTGTRTGSSGTIYLKSSAQTYGDLIINNENYISNYSSTYMDAPVAAPNTNITVGGTSINKTGQFGYGIVWTVENFGLLNKWYEFYVNPKTAQNATTTLSDDTIFKIVSSSNNSIVTSSDVTSLATSGDTYKLMMVFDNLEVRGKGNLYAPNLNIKVISGDLSSGDTTTLNQDGKISAGVMDVGSATWNATANATGSTITNRCGVAGTSITINCP